MLLYFILGILFISLGIPLLENIQSLLSSWTEYLIYILAYKIYLIKQKIKEMSDEEQEEQEEFKIGFHQHNEIQEIKSKETTS